MYVHVCVCAQEQALQRVLLQILTCRINKGVVQVRSVQEHTEKATEFDYIRQFGL